MNPLQRKAALQRRTPLARKTPLKAKGWWNPPRKPLPKASAKRQKEQRERTRMLRETFGTSPMCAVPGCNRFADDAHEVLSRARGGSITDPAGIVPLCRTHHNEITDTEPAWAYELGLLRHSWERTA